MKHIPVLLKETLQLLALKPGDVCVDATFGGGGHAKALSDRVGKKGRVLAIDADHSAISKFPISKFQFPNVTITHGNFRDIAVLAQAKGLEKVNAILFDLGMSSLELDDASRGFSFQQAGPLDMRFDVSSGETAAELLARSSEHELFRMFKDYGEERFAKRIAYRIITARSQSAILRTSELFELIKQALPGEFRHKARDSARRVFQALRIAVNKELESLRRALPQAVELLASGGRLAVIAFHSLEDRMVKNFFAEESRGCVCPPEFPECICGKKPRLRVLTKKPQVASPAEILANSRARPAKLRVAVKV